jgi:hypothetical protein
MTQKAHVFGFFLLLFFIFLISWHKVSLIAIKANPKNNDNFGKKRRKLLILFEVILDETVTILLFSVFE